jgi:hypothetical protein
MKIFIASARRKAATMGLAAVTLAASIGAVCAQPARLSRDEQFYGTSAAPKSVNCPLTLGSRSFRSFRDARPRGLGASPMRPEGPGNVSD